MLCNVLPLQFEEILESSHCALPMGLNTEELLNTKFFCSSYPDSSKALHAVWLSADTVLKNCSSSYIAPLPRMQQGCSAGPGECSQLGMARQQHWKGTVPSPCLLQEQPWGWNSNTSANQAHLCWNFSPQQSFTVQLQIGVGTVMGHTQQDPKYQWSIHR